MSDGQMLMTDEELLKQASEYRAGLKQPSFPIMAAVVTLASAVAIGVLWLAVWLGKFLLGLR